MSWNGMLGMVIKKEVEVGINMLEVANFRMDVAEFLPPIFSSKVSVYVREIDATHNTFIEMITPFTSELWATIFATMILFILIQTAVSNIGGHYTSQQQRENQLPHSCLYVFGAFCQQGYNITQQFWASRAVYVTLHIAALVLHIAYSANFISSLAVQKRNFPLTTFEDLLNDGTFKIGVRAKSLHEDYFKKSSNPILKEVYEKMIKTNTKSLPTSFENGLRRVCEERKFGFFTAQRTLLGLKQNISCKVVDIPRASYTATISFIINRGSPYKRLFTRLIQDMRKAGIMQRIDNYYWLRESKEILQDPPTSVTFETVSVYFALLAAGIFISAVLLSMEIRCRKR